VDRAVVARSRCLTDVVRKRGYSENQREQGGVGERLRLTSPRRNSQLMVYSITYQESIVGTG